MIRGYLPQEPRFLSLKEILTLHETAIDAHGGSHGVRDHGLLDSAIAMPRQAMQGEYIHEFPFGMAAAYLFHVCANHPFADGNKRTALAASVVFLRLNGWLLRVDEDRAADAVLAVASGSMNKDQVSDWIKRYAHPRPTFELRDFMQRLDYATLGSLFGAIAAGHTPERMATIIEAGSAIPAITQANLGAVSAAENGDVASAQILRQHSILLTAIYRIAEDMGYEW